MVSDGHSESDLLTFICDVFLAVFKSTNDQININLRKITCNIFFNISSLGSVEQVKVLLSQDLLSLFCGQLHNQNNFDEDTFEVSQSNEATQLNIFHLQFSVIQFSNQLCLSPSKFQTMFEVMNNILRDFYRRDHHAYHQVCSVINECGGFIVISRMIDHSSESISNVALQLNQYAGNICPKCNESPSTIESMQQ